MYADPLEASSKDPGLMPLSVEGLSLAAGLKSD